MGRAGGGDRRQGFAQIQTREKIRLSRGIRGGTGEGGRGSGSVRQGQKGGSRGQGLPEAAALTLSPA